VLEIEVDDRSGLEILLRFNLIALRPGIFNGEFAAPLGFYGSGEDDQGPMPLVRDRESLSNTSQASSYSSQWGC
jgi:hypothetical protein